MGFEILKESYSGAIKQISIGQKDTAVIVGGQSCYPFYQFEGKIPNKPRIAMEVWDMAPDDWPEAALVHFKDVASDPAAWAKKCVEAYGAEIIVLQMKSTDPNTRDTSPGDAAAVVKKVVAAVNVPVIVWGTANVQKDEAVLKKISEENQGANLTLGPVEDKNHKGIGASAMGFGHTIISSSPIDVNLAKQINILLENLGVPMNRILIDPTTGGLGYGLEYSYSIMERIRMAALSQGDDKLQFPIINNIGNEIWKCKEAKLSVQDAPTLGDAEKRGILMESVGAVCYLMAGADILIMRHPESVRLVKSFIDLALNGGSAAELAPIRKKLDVVDIDLASLAPAPDLTIEKAKEKKEAPAKVETAPKADKPAEKVAAKAPAVEKKEVPAKVETAPKADKPAETQAKAEAQAQAQARAEAEAKAKIEAEAQAKAAAEAQAKAAAEAKAKAAAEAQEKARTAEIKKREAAEDTLRQQRAAEREAMMAKRAQAPGDKPAMTPAAEQFTMLDNILAKLNRIHKRNVDL
ncbi:MAG: acetyl-CoA decarbonylase/synthase complex subunit delta [Desulfobacterales bacterium]|nr:acetyl-CoA decarbonylase/synthase complex subunit delta [Desulfobacterales bacterium]